MSTPVDRGPSTPTAPSRWELARRPRVWGVHGRIAAALVVVVALLITVVSAAALVLLETRRAEQEVVHDYNQVLRSSQEYFIAMLDAETSIRGYALIGDRSALDPLEESGRPWDNPVSPLARRLLPDSAATPDLEQAESAAHTWFTDWAAPTIANLDAGTQLSTADFDTGKELFDRFRAAYDTYIATLRPEREIAATHLARVTDLGFAVGLLNALICLVAGVVLWRLMRRWVSRPVEHLAGQARIVANGELDHRVLGLGPPEFVQLGADVELMRLKLVEEIDQADEARREVARARASLEEQTEELQRSNRELEQFAYVASHDLQEPLRKVASFCQMLQRRYGGQLDDRADQYIHFAVDGAKRMQQLINDLLEFSRVGRISSPSADVDLAECLSNALFSLEAAREESGAEISADSLPTIHGEAPLLTQLLQNLIGNAIKFRSGSAPRIRISCRRDGEVWSFACSDNGIGIAPEYAERVFLIFQRLHAKEVYGGTGIGLAMCKKIVEYHGGRIWVDESPAAQSRPEHSDTRSDPDRVGGADPVADGPGTTIRWTLPVLADESPAESAAQGLGQGPVAAAVDQSGQVDRAGQVDPPGPAVVRTERVGRAQENGDDPAGAR